MLFWMDSPFMAVWGIFAILFGILGIIFFLVLMITMYVFSAYVLAKIGGKFNIGSFPQFLVPIYNIILLCDCAKVERWVAVGIVLPLVSGILRIGFLGWVITLIAFASHVYLWGNIARRLGKEFWLWGIIVPLLGWLPAIILAFDSSHPSDTANNIGDGQGVKYIEI